MMLRTNRVLMICATSALLAAGAEPLLAQPPAGRQGQSRQEVLRQRIMQRVLGGVVRHLGLRTGQLRLCLPALGVDERLLQLHGLTAHQRAVPDDGRGNRRCGCGP